MSKCIKSIVFFCLILLLSINNSFAEKNTQWVKIPFTLRTENPVSLLYSNKGTVFLGTARALYKSTDKGKSWSVSFQKTDDNKQINKIYSNNNKIYIATDQGVFVSIDDGQSWFPVSDSNVKDNPRIVSIAIDNLNKTMYFLKYKQLFRIRDGSVIWEKVDTVPVISSEAIVDSNMIMFDKKFNDIEVDQHGKVYLATDNGVFISEDMANSWKQFATKADYDQKVNKCLLDKNENVYLGTNLGVYLYEKNKDSWENLYAGLEDVLIKDISFMGKDEDTLWIIAGNNIYRSYDNPKQILNSWYLNINGERTVQEVQKIAIRYAEVHPDKINNWRKSARMKAILPKLTFGVDNNSSDTYEIYTSMNNSYYIDGPRDNTAGWDITLSWDLSDLIYNNDQTTIDNRSKLMVQLRDDILRDVTRIYFERRRLQLQLNTGNFKNMDKAIETKLRVQELGAYIDAYTGGWFSAQISTSDNEL